MTDSDVVKRWYPHDVTCEHDGCHEEMFTNAEVGKTSFYGLPVVLTKRLCVKHYAEHLANESLKRLKDNINPTPSPDMYL